jgi:hypothetical protein
MAAPRMMRLKITGGMRDEKVMANSSPLDSDYGAQ